MRDIIVAQLNALFTYRLLDFESIKEIYDDIEIQSNEENEIELGFRTKKIARNFVKVTSRLSVIYREVELDILCSSSGYSKKVKQ